MKWFDRILSASPKQTAVGFLVAGFFSGAVLAALVFRTLWKLDAPIRDAAWLAGEVFVGGFIIGALPSAVLFLVHLRARRSPDPSLWAPFQSAVVKEICRHLTEDEKRQIRRRAAAYGVLCAVTLAIPFGLAVSTLSTPAIVAAGVLLPVYVLVTVWYTRREKAFLSGTEYAREKGIRPEDFKLRSWKGG